MEYKDLKNLYEETIKDEYIVESLEQINEKINFVIDHGTLHVKNLENYADKICKVFNLPDKVKYLAKIAIIFHDFGRLVSREEHSKHSLPFAENYLKDKVSGKNLNLILDAILKHERELFDYDSTNNVAWIVLMADKLDYTRDRYIEKLMKEKYKLAYSYRIKSFDLKVENNNLKIIASAYDVEDEMIEKFRSNFELFKKVGSHFGANKTEVIFTDINTGTSKTLEW